MSLIPKDISVYYSKPETNILYQGDILSATDIGMKDDVNSPDFWLIITKSCDLVYRNGEKKLKNDGVSILGMFSFKKYFELIRKKYIIKPKTDYLGKIVIAGVLKFSESTKSITKKEQIDALIEDKITKLMFLPPDGNVFTEPMILDFDLVFPLSGEDVEKITKAKKIQLSSPFRERVSQRFALHYSSIGIDDQNVKDKTYRANLKGHWEAVNK